MTLCVQLVDLVCTPILLARGMFQVPCNQNLAGGMADAGVSFGDSE